MTTVVTPAPPPDASATRRGLVNLLAQSFAGLKTFVAGVVLNAKLSFSGLAAGATTFENSVADGPTAAAFRFNNTVALANATAALFDLQNNGTSLFRLLAQGVYGAGCPAIILPELTEFRWGSCQLYSYAGNIHFAQLLRADAGIAFAGDGFGIYYASPGVAEYSGEFHSIAGFGTPSTSSTASPGAATINKPAGRSAIAIGASSVVVTNSYVVATDQIIITALSRDATCRDLVVDSVSNGSFQVSGVANATAATKFMWHIHKAY